MLILLLLLKIFFYGLLVIGTLAVGIIAYFKWSFQFWKKQGICYLEPSIPFGNLVNRLTKKVSRMEELSHIYKTLKKQGRKHGGIYQFAAPTYFVVDLELAKAILIKDFDHFVDRGIFANPRADPVSLHLLTLQGDAWRAMRSKITTCFTSTKLKELFDLVGEAIDSLVNKIDENIQNNLQPADNKQLCCCFTADAVGSCTLGIKCRSFRDPDSNIIKNGRAVLELGKRGQFRWLFSQVFPKLSTLLGVRLIDKIVGDFFYKVIWDTVISRRQKNVVRNDALQLLMKLNEDPFNGITKDEVVANSFGLFIGGFETSSNTLNYCLFELSKAQDYQERARKEVFGVMAKNGNKISYESLSEMKFLRQCLDETLRLYSPVHVLNRLCTKDWRVPGEDAIVKKGTTLLIHITSIHRDDEYWEKPDEFYPEHHSEENKSRRHPFAFMPFGEGKRRCIGERFGKMQLLGALATLLTRYRIFLDEKTRVPLRYKPGPMVPIPIDGIWLRYEKL